jgi:hypothetical protein
VAELDPNQPPGTMYVRAAWNSGSTTASAWMVEGHFFNATGRLATVSALPSVWYDWFFGCGFEAAHTDGAIGMFVGAYDPQWQWLGPLVDVPVGNWWSHSGSALDSSQNNGSSSGYALSAVVANLEPGFHYAVGVKVGVDSSSKFRRHIQQLRERDNLGLPPVHHLDAVGQAARRMASDPRSAREPWGCGRLLGTTLARRRPDRSEWCPPSGAVRLS